MSLIQLQKLFKSIRTLKPLLKGNFIDNAIASLMAETKYYDQQKKVQVRVGYRTRYAIYVHEDLTQRHQSGKEGKFLEKPLRQMVSSGEVTYIVGKNIRQTKDLRFSLLEVARKLEHYSLMIVPVDTGKLKSSSFVESKY